MTINLEKVSKRYTEEWILKNISFQFQSDNIYGIRGRNGSGKSTLIKIISGYLSPSLGELTYIIDADKYISREDIYKYCSLWSPHSSLLHHLSIEELVKFFFTFKKMRNGVNYNRFFKLTNLNVPVTHSVNSLSSGQSQRLGLALSILCESKILLLDEPSSFLDESSQDWFFQLIRANSSDRIIIISSNELEDLKLAAYLVDVEKYK